MSPATTTKTADVSTLVKDGKPLSRDQWANLTAEQRTEYSKAKKAKAVAAINAEGSMFPAGIRFKVGEHTLTAKPSGMSDKGSVSYAIAPCTITVAGKSVRINKFSASVLNGHTEEEDLSSGEFI